MNLKIYILNLYGNICDQLVDGQTLGVIHADSWLAVDSCRSWRPFQAQKLVSLRLFHHSDYEFS
jgi:hypothetical protein